MSTVEVSNIHLESTGNNRIQIIGSNVSIFQSGKPMLTANSTEITLTRNDVSFPILSSISGGPYNLNSYRLGDIVTKYDAQSSLTIVDENPFEFVSCNVILSQAAYPSLFSLVGGANTGVERWFTVTSANNFTPRAVTYGNGVFVAVGPSGSIQTSTDGITWTNRTSANTGLLYGVAYGNGVFVAVGSVGSPAIQSSTDGITWTNRTSANTNSGAWLFAVTYGEGIFVVTGRLGAIQTSTDGITWTNRTSASTSATDSVAYGTGTFVAVGSNDIQSSTDGITWTSRTAASMGTNGFSAVTYHSSGGFVAVGGDSYSSVIQTSPTGTTWTNRTSANNSYALLGVAYGNGVYVAVGNNGIIQSSTDAITWRDRGYNSFNGGSFTRNAVAFGNGVFVSVGGSSAGSPAFIQRTIRPTTEFTVIPPYNLINPIAKQYVKAT
jgi:hypothetical protein